MSIIISNFEAKIILFMSSLKKFITKAISLLPPPIEKELPFLVLFFLLIALSPIKLLIAGLLNRVSSSLCQF